MLDSESVEPRKFRVQVSISSLSNERRTLQMGEFDQDGIQGVVRIIDAAFATVRNSSALSLTDRSGLVTFVNTNNVAFIEVTVQDV